MSVILSRKDSADASVVERASRAEIFTATISGLASLIGSFSISTGIRKFSAAIATLKNRTKWTATTGGSGDS